MLAPVFLLAAVGSAGADSWSLRLGMSAGGYYNLPTKETEEDRGIVTLGPLIDLNAAENRYRLSVNYRPVVKLIATTGWAHAWDHRVSANFAYDLGELTILSMNDVYQDVSIYNFEDGINPDGTVDINQSVSFERAKRNNAEMTLQHFLSPRWVVSGTVGHNFAEFNEASRTNSQTVSGSVKINHIYSRNQNGGLGLSSTYSLFDESTRSEAERYGNLQIFAAWQYKLKEWLRFEFVGGPALQFLQPRGLSDQPSFRYLGNQGFSPPAPPLFADYNSCTQGTASSCTTFTSVPPSTFQPEFATPEDALAATQFIPVKPNPTGASTSVTFFGSASASVKLGDWGGQLGIRRTQSDQSGEGPASIVTGVSLRGRWEPDPYWSLNASVSWSLREQIGSTRTLGGDFDVVQGPGDVAQYSARQSVAFEQGTEQTQYYASLGVVRRLTDQLAATATASFVHQIDRREETIDRFSVRVNLSYSFQKFTF